MFQAWLGTLKECTSILLSQAEAAGSVALGEENGEEG